MAKPSISVIGTGALGSVLANALHNQGFEIKGLYNRSESKAAALGEELNPSFISEFPETVNQLGDLVFLTVPDRAIEDSANRLSQIGIDFSNVIIAHCSGNYPSHILFGLIEKGASTASFHPLQTFTGDSKPKDFEGIYIDMEGEQHAIEILRDVVEQLGASPLEVEPEAKPYLHAAAVMASNYMVALMEAASQTAELGGISKKEALQALLPLAKKSMANISRSSSLDEALSGPIARGDASTVQNQLEKLQNNPDLQQLYRQLGKVLLKLKQEAGENQESDIVELAKILTTGDGTGGTK